MLDMNVYESIVSTFSTDRLLYERSVVEESGNKEYLFIIDTILEQRRLLDECNIVSITSLNKTYTDNINTLDIKSACVLPVEGDVPYEDGVDHSICIVLDNGCSIVINDSRVVYLEYLLSEL